jgi:drug/metabolite transporter (DMT)-like permease
MKQVPPPFLFAGEFAALAAALAWAISLSVFKRAGAGVPANVLNLYKNVVALVCMAIAAVVIWRPMPSDPMLWLVLGISGVAGLAIGDTGLFAALSRLGAQAASAIQSLAPPMAAGIAALFLRETLTVNQWLGLGITVAGVGGVVYFRNRGQSHLSRLATGVVVWGTTFAVIGALGQALGVVIARQALQKTNVLHGTMMRLIPAILVLLAAGLARGGGIGARRVFADGRRAGALTGAAVLGAFVGLLLLSVGVKYSKAGVAAALSSTFPIWTIPIAVIFLKEHVSWQSAVCTVAAVVGVGLMFVGPGG